MADEISVIYIYIYIYNFEFEINCLLKWNNLILGALTW